MSRADAEAIWWAGVRAVDPVHLVEQALSEYSSWQQARRILVVGAGKAGAGMAAGVERALADRLDQVTGIVNVPAGTFMPLQRIRLHPARPAGVNEPRPEGIVGAEEMLRLLSTAEPEDVALCLLSGGGSALLPAPAQGISLEDKLAVTRLLHRCGASITEMNCVRKHLSRIKGGQLAQVFRGQRLLTLVISDVVGDPLDVIASGPTVPDPTTFAEACQILQQYGLWNQVPASVRNHLEAGRRGEIPDTPKSLPPSIQCRIIGNNRLALNGARHHAQQLGYPVLDCGAFIEGETRVVAQVCAGLIRSIFRDGQPVTPPVCLLMGGETTVTLDATHGLGGRNQEFVLALCGYLDPQIMPYVTILSAGTDGEDGPTDAAGAVADQTVWQLAKQLDLRWQNYLQHHNSYSFWKSTGGLLITGLTGTNVMDLRVLIIRAPT